MSDRIDELEAAMKEYAKQHAANMAQHEAVMARIDARLDRLTERHEALAQSLELQASMQRDADSRIAQLITAVQQDGENIRALARIAEIHERRLSDLEDQN